jgi:hypothetical protein
MDHVKPPSLVLLVQAARALKPFVAAAKRAFIEKSTTMFDESMSVAPALQPRRAAATAAGEICTIDRA